MITLSNENTYSLIFNIHYCAGIIQQFIETFFTIITILLCPKNNNKYIEF